MTTPTKGPATQSSGNPAGFLNVGWSGTNQTAVVGPAGLLVPLGAGGGVALYDGGGNSITSGSALFSNANNVSFGIVGQTVTASVVPGGSNLALYDGTNSISSGTAQFSNANGVSFGFNGQTITASVAAAGGAQTGISSLIAGQTQTVGALSFSNANGVSFGIVSGANTGTLTASVLAQTVQAQTLTVSAANTSYTVPNLSFSNANNVSFSLSNNSQIYATATVPAQTGISGIVVSNTTYLSGTVSFSNANGISFGSSAGQAITASYTVPTVTNSSMTVSDAATSGTLARLAFTNLNGVTLSLSTGAAGSHTIVGSVVTTYLTSQSNQAFSAQGGSSAFQTLNFTNSNNVSFSNTGGSVWGSFALNVSATGGTSNALSGLTFKDGNGVSFGLSTGAGVGTITASIAVAGGAQTGISSIADSANTQTVGMLSFANSNGISFGLSTGANTATLTASYTVPSTAGLISAINVSANATSENITQLVFSNNNGVSFGLATAGGGPFATITASVAPQATGSLFEPELFGSSANITFANGTAYFRPFYLNNNLQLNRIAMLQQHTSQSVTTYFASASVSSQTSSTAGGSWGQSGTWGIFSRKNTATSAADYSRILSFVSGTYSYSYGVTQSVSWSTNASSATASVSMSNNAGFVSQIGTNGAITSSNSGTTYSTTFSSTSTAQGSFSSSFSDASTSGSRMFSGVRPVYFPMANTVLIPGDYWLMHIQSTTSGSTGNSRLDRYCMQADAGYIAYQTSNQGILPIGSSTTLGSTNFKFGLGSHSAATNSTTTMALADISSLASNMSQYFIGWGQSL